MVCSQMTKFSAFDHGLYIAHDILPMGQKLIFDSNTPTERAPFKLSENHKIIEIWSQN